MLQRVKRCCSASSKHALCHTPLSYPFSPDKMDPQICSLGVTRACFWCLEDGTLNLLSGLSKWDILGSNDIHQACLITGWDGSWTWLYFLSVVKSAERSWVWNVLGVVCDCHPASAGRSSALKSWSRKELCLPHWGSTCRSWAEVVDSLRHLPKQIRDYHTTEGSAKALMSPGTHRKEILLWLLNLLARCRKLHLYEFGLW